MTLLVWHVLQAAAVVLVVEAAFVGGFFFSDGFVVFPLMALTMVTVAAKAAGDYRRDVGYRALVARLESERWNEHTEAELRHAQVMDDLTRVGVGAVRMATTPTLLTAQLNLLTPLLTDLLATRSPGRRRHLLDELEAGVVQAAWELVRTGTGTGTRAVLYLKVGRRFEAALAQGDCGSAVPPAARNSLEAQEMRSVLRQHQPAAFIDEAGSEDRSGVRIPLHAGRRGIGVLRVERAGQPFNDAEVDALVVVARLLTAGATGSRLAPTPGGAEMGREGSGDVTAMPSARGRRRWEPDVRVDALVGTGRTVRASVLAGVDSALHIEECRRVVRRALGDGARLRASGGYPVPPVGSRPSLYVGPPRSSAGKTTTSPT